jgi:hypothetical protein
VSHETDVLLVILGTASYILGGVRVCAIAKRYWINDEIERFLVGLMWPFVAALTGFTFLLFGILPDIYRNPREEETDDSTHH